MVRGLMFITTYVGIGVLGAVIGREFAPVEDRVDQAISEHIFRKSISRLEGQNEQLRARYEELVATNDCEAIITTIQCIKDRNILTISEQLKARIILRSGKPQ